MRRSILDISLGNFSNLLFSVHNLILGPPDLDEVGVPVVPDVHTPTALRGLDEITSILADNLLNARLPLLGHLEMPVVGFAQGRVIDLGVAIFHGVCT